MAHFAELDENNIVVNVLVVNNEDTVDGNGDAFVFQPFPSWIYNSSTVEYEPPIPRPDGNYEWREDVYNADASDPKTQGWVDVTEYLV